MNALLAGSARRRRSGAMAWLGCWFRDCHDPVRHPLGGFRCGDCGRAGLDFEEMGFDGGAYVAALRPTFSRE